MYIFLYVWSKLTLRIVAVLPVCGFLMLMLGKNWQIVESVRCCHLKAHLEVRLTGGMMK